ncbi:hypothetical protein SUDANB176_07368 [Streptomyces sp. enrichment culture]
MEAENRSAGRSGVGPHDGSRDRQQPDGAHGPRPSRALGPGACSVMVCDQSAVPAQRGVRTHRRPYPAQHLRGKAVQQRRQERAIVRREPNLPATESALQHRDPMPEGENLRVLVPVAHGQQAQHGERVRHGQVSQSQQHDQPSCRGRQSRESTGSSVRAREPAHPAHRLPPRRTRFSARATLTSTCSISPTRRVTTGPAARRTAARTRRWSGGNTIPSTPGSRCGVGIAAVRRPARASARPRRARRQLPAAAARPHHATGKAALPRPPINATARVIASVR